MLIYASALEKGIRYYQLAIDKFMGNSVISRLKEAEHIDDTQLRLILSPTASAGEGEWVDICGLIAPKSEIARMCHDITSVSLNDVEEINSRFREIHLHYYNMEWNWVAENFASWWGKPIEKLTILDIEAIINRWKESVVTLDRMLYEDARKEFSMASKVGFGLDADTSQCKEADFEQVRGEFEHDPFVNMVINHIEEKTTLGNNLIARLK